jgi:putative endonuclease
MSHWVYIIRSERNGRHYTGSSADPLRRLADHNTGKVTATKYLRPWSLVYVEEFPDAASARQREYHLKSMKSRVYFESLINRSVG